MTITNKKQLTILAIIGTVFLTYGVIIDVLNTTNPISQSDIFRLSLSFLSNVFGMTYIYFIIQEKIWSYILGILGAITTTIYLIFWSPLIWDIVVNIIYFSLCFYGIYYWFNPDKQQKTNHNIAKTRILTQREKFSYMILSFIATIFLTVVGYKIGRYENIIQVIADAITTVAALLAQWLTTRKIIDSWLLWCLVNIISIPLYISIHSYTLAVSFAFYLILSITGYFMWRSEMVTN